MFSSVLGFHFGQQETELRWTQERERLLAHQIETLQRKDREISELEKSIGVLNDSALRVASETSRYSDGYRGSLESVVDLDAH